MQDLIEMYKYIARDTIDEYKMLVNRVLALSFKRDMYNKLKIIENNCLDASDEDINKLYTTINNEINKLAENYIMTENIEVMGSKVDKLWEEICSRRNSNGIYGIASKYPLINNYFTYEPGELILFQARMKRGKSAFMMNETLHKLKNGIPTAYLDSEMSSRLFMERMLSALTRIPLKKIKLGDYTSTEEKLIKDAMEWIKKQPFVHHYEPTWTNENIYTICKVLKTKMNLGFVVFDYLKSNTLSSSEQYNELGGKCDFLKNNIAGAMQIPVLAGAQLNRNNQTADSDKLERYCSVSLIWREKSNEEIITDGKECGNYSLNVKLNRLGEQMMDEDYIDFMFNGNTMTIEQAKQHENTQPF
jgi:replicative DNA helicase